MSIIVKQRTILAGFPLKAAEIESIANPTLAATNAYLASLVAGCMVKLTQSGAGVAEVDVCTGGTGAIGMLFEDALRGVYGDLDAVGAKSISVLMGTAQVTTDWVVASGAISVGAPLYCGANGKLTASSGGAGNKVVAIALTAKADGDTTMDVLLTPGNSVSAS